MPCMMMCQDPQTEFALLRESLGVSRTNHVLRLHGHIILKKKKEPPKYLMKLGNGHERLFPGITAVWNKPRSGELNTLPAQHTLEHPFQPNHRI